MYHNVFIAATDARHVRKKIGVPQISMACPLYMDFREKKMMFPTVFLSFSWNFVTGPGARETRAILGDHIPVVLLSRHNISICIYA